MVKNATAISLVDNDEFVNELIKVYNNDELTDKYKQMVLCIIIEKIIMFNKLNVGKWDVDKISHNQITNLFEYKQNNLFNHNTINERLDLLQDSYLIVLSQYKYIYESHLVNDQLTSALEEFGKSKIKMVDLVFELYKREKSKIN